MRHQQVHRPFAFRFFLNIIQQIIDSLRKLQHGLPTIITVDKLRLGNRKFRTISRCGLIPSKILLLQPQFFLCRNAGHFRDMLCGICRTHQRRIQNLINMDSFCLNPFTQFLCLCMSKFCECNICRATDFILYIPDCLSMSCKIKVCHRICPSCIFYQDTTISNP